MHRRGHQELGTQGYISICCMALVFGVVVLDSHSLFIPILFSSKLVHPVPNTWEEVCAEFLCATTAAVQTWAGGWLV
jgi:hypothetical protein